MERIAGRKPNVILITTDQQRYDSIGINGSSFMSTPNMDAIGQEGAVFRRAYCPNTVCTPSRVSIMTGLYLSRHGSYNIGTRPTWEGRFLSDILRAAGYRTHHIGKAHWHPWGADSPESREPDEDGRPFVDFAGFQTAELSVGHGNGGVKGHYASWIKRKGHDPGGFAVKPVLANDYNQTGDWELPIELHSGTWAAERAVEFIREHARGKSEQPFYLNIGFQDPHHPHILPHNYGNRIDPADIPLPDIDVADEQGTPPHVPLFRSGTLVESRFNGRFVIAGNGRGSAWGPYFQDEHKARTTRAYYYSMVQLVDEQLGRIMAALDEAGLAEDTLLIFTSDHGEMLGDHGIGQKGPLFYEGVTHIPLLMRYPRGFAPCTVDDCVSLVDLLPTILDFAGVADEARRDGVSLKERLQQRAELGRGGIRVEYKEEPDRIRYKGWVTERWKLAVYPGESFGELYDLQNDPGEKRNLYDDPACSGVKNELFAALISDMERSEPANERPSRV